MKQKCLLTLALLPALAFAQNGKYTVKGRVGNLNSPAKVYLMYAKGQNEPVTDSSGVKNGEFSFEGSVPEAVAAVLVMDRNGVGLQNISPNSNPDILRFYIESGEVKVSSSDSLSKAEVSGKVNNDNKALQAQLKPMNEKLAALNNEFRSASPERQQAQEFRNGLQARFEQIREQQNAVLKAFVKAHPESFVSVSAIQRLSQESSDPVEMESLIGKLSPVLQRNASIQEVSAGLQAAKKTAVGVQAMDFTQEDVNGKPVKLSDFKGKYVLLDFWASWCGPCRQENPNVVKAYNKYRDKNFTVLGVSLDRENGKDAWLKAIKDDGLTWTQVSDLKFWNNSVAVMYGIKAIPKNFLIDPAGKIVASDLRGDELDSKLAELLK